MSPDDGDDRRRRIIPLSVSIFEDLKRRQLDVGLAVPALLYVIGFLLSQTDDEDRPRLVASAKRMLDHLTAETPS